MFDADKPAWGADNPDKVATRAKFNWSAMPVEELIRNFDEIKQHLPAIKLKDLNLESELLLQFHAVRALQNDVLSDDDVPPHQRAQVANSVSSVLVKLGELQSDIYSSERFKDIENILIGALVDLPEPQVVEFLAKYEERMKSDPRTAS